MTWTEKLPSLKGIARFFYVATHWNTISHDLEEYRRQIKDREEWARTMLDNKEELHRLQTEKLEHALTRWQTLAEKGVTLAEKAQAEREDAASLLKTIFSDFFDTARLLGIVLSWEAPAFQSLLLSTLQPGARKLVENTIVKVTPAPSPFAALRVKIKDLLNVDLVNVMDSALAEALRSQAPPSSDPN